VIGGVEMKLDIYGKMEVEVSKSANKWIAYRLGEDGKKRKLHDVIIPTDIKGARRRGLH